MTRKEDAKIIMEDGQWATAYNLNPGETHYHELSHTQVWVSCLDQEWQVRFRRMAEDDDQERWLQTVTDTAPNPDLAVQRFVRPGAGHEVVYQPVMSRLAMVIRPYQPLTIPADTECTIYVGTLLWMRILVGNKQTQLLELPLADPMMTWVGRNTMEGELCYSAATFARLVLDAVPKRPWRAITPVRIVNQQDEPLLLERFSLPTPLLSLHRNKQGQLWTPRVTVYCESGMNSARLRVDSGVVAEAGDCSLVTAAREQTSRGGLIKAYDRMFG
ncbi:hypothetical protein [Marinobacter sp. CHS3-4]|uniref:hypothetical protein n=1 Tax=Marinobacter sp. CHS3-4 TaxID=3045174 RepID=UPI0024B54812|nr:hypothetical protein [Marinobacter sp. CHS3-4]MDI9246178.1 hypothetical protein [Marinobacter sp. CHS3-4]